MQGTHPSPPSYGRGHGTVSGEPTAPQRRPYNSCRRCAIDTGTPKTRGAAMEQEFSDLLRHFNRDNSYYHDCI